MEKSSWTIYGRQICFIQPSTHLFVHKINYLINSLILIKLTVDVPLTVQFIYSHAIFH